MKNVKTLLTGLFLGSVLFTSCSKEDLATDPMANSNGVTSNARTTGVSSNAARAQMTSMTMYGNLNIYSDEGTLFEREAPKYYDVSMLAGNLGSERLIGQHKNMTVAFATPADGDMNVVTISGSYYSPRGRVPVTVYIRRGFSMKQPSDYIEVRKETTLGTLMHIDMNRLTMNIEPEMWERAEMTNSGIVITDGMNSGLYDRIVGNLSAMNTMHWL